MSKLFLDTSIARSLLLPRDPWEKDLAEKWRDVPLYVSSFVTMELRRSIIFVHARFLSSWTSDKVGSLAEAMIPLRNSFRPREVKTIMEGLIWLMDALSREGEIPGEIKEDINRLTQRLSILFPEMTVFGFNHIRASWMSWIVNLDLDIEAKFRRVDSVGSNCQRGNVTMSKVALGERSLAAIFSRFIEEFGNTEAHQGSCDLCTFLFSTSSTKVSQLVNHSCSRSMTGCESFTATSQELRKLSDAQTPTASCARCERIGDAVVALESPESYVIHVRDHAFSIFREALPLEIVQYAGT